MQKIIVPKQETMKVINKIMAEKQGDISLTYLTDADYARNNGYQKEIEDIDMEANNVIIIKP